MACLACTADHKLLEALLWRAGIVLDDRAFLEAYHKWMPLQTKLEDPELLGALNFSPGKFGDCPACAKIPTFDDQGIAATRRKGLDVLAEADGFLHATQAEVFPLIGLCCLDAAYIGDTLPGELSFYFHEMASCRVQALRAPQTPQWCCPMKPSRAR